MAQFEKILKYLSKESDFAVRRVSEEIIKETNLLSIKFNHRPLDTLKTNNDGTFRVCFVFKYRISYKVDKNFIKIVAIRHSSRLPLKH